MFAVCLVCFTAATVPALTIVGELLDSCSAGPLRRPRKSLSCNTFTLTTSLQSIPLRHLPSLPDSEASHLRLLPDYYSPSQVREKKKNKQSEKQPETHHDEFFFFFFLIDSSESSRRRPEVIATSCAHASEDQSHLASC